MFVKTKIALLCLAILLCIAKCASEKEITAYSFSGYIFKMTYNSATGSEDIRVKFTYNNSGNLKGTKTMFLACYVTDSGYTTAPTNPAKTDGFALELKCPKAGSSDVCTPSEIQVKILGTKINKVGADTKVYKADTTEVTPAQSMVASGTTTNYEFTFPMTDAEYKNAKLPTLGSTSYYVCDFSSLLSTASLTEGSDPSITVGGGAPVNTQFDLTSFVKTTTGGSTTGGQNPQSGSTTTTTTSLSEGFSLVSALWIAALLMIWLK